MRALSPVLALKPLNMNLDLLGDVSDVILKSRHRDHHALRGLGGIVPTGKKPQRLALAICN
jgi:hypothetical protein